ncbi:hypothetical protein [Verrucomicrobium spinosum]|uniref:hypothetical protein n=1 Tax=Verrucomicrobium spinosum TaxID=2736 RepID=UPI00094615C8|nr:hypothetical protein [Verrucomicrobium spinosum]
MLSGTLKVSDLTESAEFWSEMDKWQLIDWSNVVVDGNPNAGKFTGGFGGMILPNLGEDYRCRSPRT